MPLLSVIPDSESDVLKGIRFTQSLSKSEQEALSLQIRKMINVESFYPKELRKKAKEIKKAEEKLKEMNKIFGFREFEYNKDDFDFPDEDDFENDEIDDIEDDGIEENCDPEPEYNIDFN